MSSFQRSKDLVLRATHETLLYYAQFDTLSVEEIHERLVGKYSSGFVSRILTSLASEQLIDVDQFDETSSRRYTLSDAGFEYVQTLPTLFELMSENYSHAEIFSVPAADRIVGLDHNSEQYSQIAAEIDRIVELARGDNEFGQSTEDRDRRVRALEAARLLWSAAELSVVQIKVGVILALEDAEVAFAEIGKAVGVGLLVDLIASFVKDRIGIDI